MTLDIDLVGFELQRLDELVPMWRASFEAAVGITDPHPLAEQRQYFLDTVLPRHDVRLALGREDGSLWPYTFARNTGARAFYEREGFVAVAHGFEPCWQLEDVKFHWRAHARA